MNLPFIKFQIQQFISKFMSQKYQGRVDPLEILRKFKTQKKKIRLKDNLLYFDNIKLKLNTETPWLSPTTKKRYDLGTLWLFLQIQQLGGLSKYIQKCTEMNVEYINVADREQILNYFNGKIETSTSINNELKIEISQRSHKREREKNQQITQQHTTTKKVKTQNQSDINLKVLDWLIKFQKPIYSKSRLLRVPQKSFDSLITMIKSFDQTRQSKIKIKTKLMQIVSQKKKMPIIIVPQSSQPGNVCIKNIRRLLQQGQYVQAATLQDIPNRKIQINYKIREKNIFFQVTNNPSLLTSTDWECVVAIFILGSPTQFKSWPQSNTQKLFKKYKGFFLKYSDTKMGDAKDWNVKKLILQKLVRYQDVTIQKYIWDQIQHVLYNKVE